MKALEKGLSDELDIEDEGTLFAERALSRQKRSLDGTIKLYENLSFLLLTSNSCERLFSHAKYALSDWRKGIHPSNFVTQMFLFSKNDLWDARDVNKIIVT